MSRVCTRAVWGHLKRGWERWVAVTRTSACTRTYMYMLGEHKAAATIISRAVRSHLYRVITRDRRLFKCAVVIQRCVRRFLWIKNLLYFNDNDNDSMCFVHGQQSRNMITKYTESEASKRENNDTIISTMENKSIMKKRRVVHNRMTFQIILIK